MFKAQSLDTFNLLGLFGRVLLEVEYRNELMERFMHIQELREVFLIK